MTDLSKYNRQDLIDKIEGLECDLEAAVEVAFKRGAHEWVRLNYRKEYERLSKLRGATNGMPCCFDIPNSGKVRGRDAPCNICLERETAREPAT